MFYEGLAEGANPYKGAMDSVEVFAALINFPKRDCAWLPAEARNKSGSGMGLSLDLTYKFKGQRYRGVPCPRMCQWRLSRDLESDRGFWRAGHETQVLARGRNNLLEEFLSSTKLCSYAFLLMVGYSIFSIYSIYSIYIYI